MRSPRRSSLGFATGLPPGMKHRFPSNPLWITAISSASPRKYSVSPGLTGAPSAWCRRDSRRSPSIKSTRGDLAAQWTAPNSPQPKSSLPPGYCLSRERFSTDELPQSDKGGNATFGSSRAGLVTVRTEKNVDSRINLPCGVGALLHEFFEAKKG